MAPPPLVVSRVLIRSIYSSSSLHASMPPPGSVTTSALNTPAMAPIELLSEFLLATVHIVHNIDQLFQLSSTNFVARNAKLQTDLQPYAASVRRMTARALNPRDKLSIRVTRFVLKYSAQRWKNNHVVTPAL